MEIRELEQNRTAGVEQEQARAKRDAQIAAILRARFKFMTTVRLDTGLCERVDLTQAEGLDHAVTGDYVRYIRGAMEHYVHPDDMQRFWAVLSLDHLRERAESIEDYAEEVCCYRQRGEPVRWIELRVIYSRQADGATVNILGQDVTREKRQEENRLQVMEDRAYIISSLSSLFFSTYYIDLEQDTFRAVTQLRRVGDVLGDEVNCSAGLQIYANHFVHPEDRAEYLRVMNVEHLRRSLRWWQPCVAVEYRRLSEEPGDGTQNWDWVRATAVLARTDREEMPKTAVYVAQDIGGGRRRPEG